MILYAGDDKFMKGIILAGGHGSRLYPVTCVTSKQLLPIYDKPMVYYPLSTLMLLGIRDILLISSPDAIDSYRILLGDGHQLGLNITYAVQESPAGIAQALIIGEEFIGRDNVTLILGDNIFYGVHDFLRKAVDFEKGARIFAYYVKNPGRYGVLEFDRSGQVISIEEKPPRPRSNYVVTGLYIYDHRAAAIARKLTPSSRGELEITDVNRSYLEQGELDVVRLGRGIAWLDTGTHDSMLAACNFIHTIEQRQGLKVACVEEVAFRMGFIDRRQLEQLVGGMADNHYKQYLLELIHEVEHE